MSILDSSYIIRAVVSPIDNMLNILLFNIELVAISHRTL